MPRLVIDNREVEVEAGRTLLDAARKLGIAIPTLCHCDGLPPTAACMLCVVKIKGRADLVPSCATRAEDGMEVATDGEEVRGARRAALELLLADHVGDCEGPCQGACPAHLDIPRMIRQIGSGDLLGAIATVKRDIVLPAVLGRICPAPCEKACRRAGLDAAVSILRLKRYVADADLGAGSPYDPPRGPATGRRVAIVGAGPTGLSAAYYLACQGHAPTVFDDHEAAGGALRYAVPPEELPPEVLDAEVARVAAAGAAFRLGTRVGEGVALADLRRDFDAVVLAVGALGLGDAERLGVEAEGGHIAADRKTHATGMEGVFAGGNAIRKGRMAVRAVADGKVIAASLGQYLSGAPVTGEARRFSVHIGRLSEGELAEFEREATGDARVEPAGGVTAGLTADEASREAGRCLHCDCRKAETCKLRLYAEEYGARAGRYKTGDRRLFAQDRTHPLVVYEAGKCITCGICVRVTERAREPLGLAFIGRGFDVRVGAPLDGSLADALRETACECVEACPTGALALKST